MAASGRAGGINATYGADYRKLGSLYGLREYSYRHASGAASIDAAYSDGKAREKELREWLRTHPGTSQTAPAYLKMEIDMLVSLNYQAYTLRRMGMLDIEGSWSRPRAVMETSLHRALKSYWLYVERISEHCHDHWWTRMVWNSVCEAKDTLERTIEQNKPPGYLP